MKRHHMITLMLFLALILPFTPGASQTKKEAAKNLRTNDGPVAQATDYSHYFTTPSPKGIWHVAAAGDAEQISDGDSPVIVAGVESLLGRGESANLLIKHVIFENRTQKPVTRITLKWMITNDEAQRSVALQGETSAFEITIPTLAQQTAEISLLDFAKIARPLMRNGALDGTFLLKLRVSEATFADGSSWNYKKATRFIKASHAVLPALVQDNCPNNGCGTGTEHGEAQCGWYVSGASGCSLSLCSTGSNGVTYCRCITNFCGAGGYRPPSGPRPERATNGLWRKLTDS